MAGPVGSGFGSKRQRVFVLVDNDSAKGVFFTWEAAEAYADEKRYSLDMLMEYETRSDYPDHLQLMAAQWDDEWRFQGAWTKKCPNWPTPPKKVRLDHYHAKGNAFHLLRQREFDWEEGLLERINPMAPDQALRSDTPTALPSPKPQWRPKIAPLKPLSPIQKAQAPEKEDPKLTLPPTEPATESKPIDETALGPQATGKAKLKLTPPAIPVANKEEEKAEPATAPKISFNKKRPLKLKTKGAPTPIPDFKPTPAPSTEDLTGKSSVELAQADPAAMATKKPVEPEFIGKPKRIWSLKLIFSIAATVLCWIAGTLWILRPEPTVASIVAEVATLNSARLIIIEPQMVFFQFDVDPAHQERWIQNLAMNPIPTEEPIGIPSYHALDTWEKPEGFIRPPFSEAEVRDWWKLRMREVKYGFAKNLENGSILLLDFESDTIIGWTEAKQLPGVLN